MIVGAAFVLVTWGLAGIVVLLLGLWPATLGARDRPDAIRGALWWGMAIAVVAVLAISLVMPLGSPAALGIVILLALAGGAVGIPRLRRLHHGPRATASAWMQWTVLGALSVAIVYLAFAALGPVTNYDTGLYHLGALRYQMEVGLVPGIANLYFPLGYGNSVMPLSAFLGSTPWGEDGFRLFNGLLMVLLAVETGLRVGRRRWTPGTWLLIAALGFVWVPMVALSDYWITSPTSDSSILILTSVSVAYLADGIVARSGTRAGKFALSLVTAWVLVSMRPTMAIFALGVLLVILARILRDRSSTTPVRGTVPLVIGTVLLGGAIAVLQVARDRILSGWLQYPLSVFSFDVPWRAADPVGFRTATLGAARDPDDLWAAAESWTWIPGWLTRVPTQWEFWLAAIIALGSAVLVLIAHRHRRPWRPRAMLLAVAPSALATGAWFIASPPSFRFIWGPLFTLVALPGAFAAVGLARPGSQGNRSSSRLRVAAPAAAVALIAVISFSFLARLDVGSITQQRELSLGPVHLSYVVTPVPMPPVSTGVLESGLEVRVPVESDQCWDVYPFCTAQIEPTVRMIGTDLSDGFAR